MIPLIKKEFKFMQTKKDSPPLIWLDLEMTGLDPDSERIIEIATVVTSGDLEEVFEGPNLVIKQPQEFIDGMDDWNLKQHGSSGLLECLKVTEVTELEAEKANPSNTKAQMKDVFLFLIRDEIKIWWYEDDIKDLKYNF